MQKVSELQQQLPLNLNSSADKTFDNFLVGKNAPVINSLIKFIEADESLFYLWGVSASGKSHILKALTKQPNKNKHTIINIASTDIAKRENISLISMFEVICIDNVENIASDAQLEQSLFHWINEVRQAHKKIILASQVSNKSEKWQLPDLISRLQAGQTHELKPLNRVQCLQVFNQQARQQGISIDTKTEKFLSNNCPMNMKFLAKLLIKLDEATLVHKKSATIPLIKQIIDSIVEN